MTSENYKKKTEEIRKMIYVVGSLNMDLCIESPYMPKAGETITGSGFITNGGGKGANQAIAAAKLGGNVAMCGAVGDDLFGERLIKNLSEAGADVSHIKKCDDAPTGIAVIVITDGNNRIILDKGANALLSENDIREFLKNAKKGDVYLTQLENPVDVIGYGLKHAKEKGMFTILNPAPANKEIIPYLCYCDLITPNESETELLGGEDFLLEKTEIILKTLGGDGFEIIGKDERKRYPCMKIQPVDTTAAGDTLCGGLAAQLSKGKSIEEAALFGSKAATIACTKKGAQQSIPSYEEVVDY